MNYFRNHKNGRELHNILQKKEKEKCSGIKNPSTHLLQPLWSDSRKGIQAEDKEGRLKRVLSWSKTFPTRQSQFYSQIREVFWLSSANIWYKMFGLLKLENLS